MKSKINGTLLVNGDPCEWIKALALFGFSAKYIAKNTNCTTAIVYHTIYRSGIKLSAYRDGKSPLAKQIMHALEHAEKTLKLQ